MNKYLLQMKEIKKIFPSVVALDGVDFSLSAGEVHGLLGENGAGKSTLINILGGVFSPDKGEIIVNGKTVNIKNVKDSQNLGIAIIHQELGLEPYMTISENVFLGREITGKFGINTTLMKKKTLELLQRVGLEFQPDVTVSKLSVGQQQMVEIAKALSLDAKIFVMDEPTSSLTSNEVKKLFSTVRVLKDQGVGIVFVSHKMDELFSLTDRITVIRDGKYIGTKNTSTTNEDELIHMMVGRTLTSFYSRSVHEIGETVLEVRHISRSRVVNDVSFSLRKGEILGFAGLVGAGRSELFQSILGIYPKESGEVYLFGEKIDHATPSLCQKLGLVLVPEDRKQQGLILKHAVGFNLTINVIDQFIRGISVDKEKEASIETTFAESLSIKTPSMKQTVGKLSGGNQQKVLIGKWLATKPRILILDEPTRGIDVGTKAEIYKKIDELASAGLSVVIISSEMRELLNMCDRILVMHEGNLTGEFMRDDFSQEKIMKCAAGR